MTTTTTDSIRKQITLKAPRSRVWRAISDSQEFGQWFGVRLEGPFRVGEVTRGQITYPGCEHMVLEANVERIEPETCLAFRWFPYDTSSDVEPGVVVMGTLARSGIRGLLIGNTAERILDDLDASVIAVKPPGFVSPVAG